MIIIEPNITIIIIYSALKQKSTQYQNSLWKIT